MQCGTKFSRIYDFYGDLAHLLAGDLRNGAKLEKRVDCCSRKETNLNIMSTFGSVLVSDSVVHKVGDLC